MELLISNLVNFFLLSSAMVIVALMIRAVMQKKLNISIMMMIWMVVLIRMIVPFILNAPIHVSDFFESEPEIIESSDVLSVNQETSTTVLAESNTNNIAINQTQTANIQPIEQNETVELGAESMPNTLTQFFKALNYKKIAVWVWAIGVFVAFVMHMTKLLIFKNRIKPYMRRVKQSNILFKNQKRIGLFKMVSLYECACIDMPMTMGLIKPRIIIPKGLVSNISSEKLDMILTHELCHIKRYDLLKAYLWLVAKSIHWFNPFVYMAYNAYLEDMESLCDKTVISYFDDKKAEAIYAQALVDVIKLAKFSDEPYALISFCKDKTKLRKRVIQMIDPNKKSKFVGIVSVLLIMIAMVGCFTTACFKGEEEVVIAEPETKVVEVKAEPVVAENKEKEQEQIEESKEPEPVGTEERAIEIAMSYNISGAKSMTYDSYDIYNQMKIHRVKANDDTNTYYTIYDFDGSLCSMMTMKKDTDYEDYKIDVEQAQKNAVEIIKSYYPKYDDIDVKVTKTGTEDNHSAQFVVKGAMVDNETSTKRNIFIVLDAAGEFDSMRCEIDAESLDNISSELKSKVLQYSLTDDTYIKYIQSTGFYGDEILIFAIDDGHTMVKMLESDESFVSLATKLFNVETPVKIDVEQALNIVKNKSLDYFPNSELTINQYGWVEDLEPYIIFEANGNIQLENGVILEFNSELNGKGELIDIGVTPQKLDNTESVISKEDAEQKAKEAVYEQLPKSKDKLKVVKAYEGVVNNGDVFIFDIQYRTENPTAFDFSFDVTIEVFKSNGKALGRTVSPIYEGLSMISEQEAIEKAKEYILDEYSLDEDKMKFMSIEILPFGPIEYHVVFEYEEYTYSAGLIIDTGELDGIGMNG